jgi:hypothetical protein
VWIGADRSVSYAVYEGDLLVGQHVGRVSCIFALNYASTWMLEAYSPCSSQHATVCEYQVKEEQEEGEGVADMIHTFNNTNLGM